MSPLLSTFASASARGWNPGVATSLGAMELISSTLLATSASSVTFSSIPSTYSHLQLRITSRHDGSVQAVQTNVYFNADQAANYAWHGIEGTGSAVYAASQTSKNNIYIGGTASGLIAANSFSAYVVDLLDYGNTSKYKTIRALGGYADGSRQDMNLASGLWMSTSAITSITLAPVLQGGNFVSGSRFSLYGIKG